MLLWKTIAKCCDDFFDRIEFNLANSGQNFLSTLGDKQARSVIKKAFLAAHFLQFDDELAKMQGNKAFSSAIETPDTSRLILPFKTIWMEHTGEKTLASITTHTGFNFQVAAILCDTLDDLLLIAYLFCLDENHKRIFITPITIPLQKIKLSGKEKEQFQISPLIEITTNIMSYYLNLLRSKDTGFANQKDFKKIKARIDGRKQTRLVKEVIAVLPKNKAQKVYGSRAVGWSHMWEVMGHWRKVPGIGKDRFGIACVPGLTWVSPHTKGKGELIKKTRTYTTGCKNQQN